MIRYVAFTPDNRTKLEGIEDSAEANNISDTDATDLTDGGETTLHSHPSASGASVYGELLRSTDGNQSIGTTAAKLDFNLNGQSNSTTVSATNDKITVLEDGPYTVAFTGSAILKRNALHRIFVRTNGVAGSDVQIICAEVPDDNYCWALSGSVILDLAEDDYIEIWCTIESTKDFKMQIGTGFSVVKI